MELYTVYAKTDATGHVTTVNSSAFLADTIGWTEIDTGYGDKYHHAQGNYFSLPILTDGGAYRYKLVDGAPVECTAEEIAAQEAAKQTDTSNQDTAPVTWSELAEALREGVNSV